MSNKPIRKCIDCKQDKSSSQFTRWIQKVNRGEKKYAYPRFSSVCKPCMVVRSVKWKKDNKEKFNKYQDNYNKKRGTE